MTPATILLITQLIALATQAAAQIVTLRQQMGTASASSEAQNLVSAEASLAEVVQHAQIALRIGGQPAA